MVPKAKAGRPARVTNVLWMLCLGMGAILLLAGRDIWVPAAGFVLTGTAFFLRLSEARRIRSLLKWMIPVLVFLAAYAFILHIAGPASATSSGSEHVLGRVAYLFFRSVGLLFVVFSLEEALRPLAVRARAGGLRGGRMALMLGLSYQLVPVFMQSLEGVALSQRVSSRFWWARPSGLLRACSSLFLLSHRLSEEMALALSLRLRQKDLEQ